MFTGCEHVQHNGRAVQFDSNKTRVESAYGFSAGSYHMMNCSQILLSISTCAADQRASRSSAATNLTKYCRPSCPSIRP